MRIMLIRTSVVVISIILASLICYNCSAEDKSHFSEIVYVGGSGPGNYSTIKEAIDHVSSGGTVFVYNGTYYEHHIKIDKKLSLIGEDKTSTIINAVGKYKGVIIKHDDVLVKGFTIRNTSYVFDWWHNSCIEVLGSKNVVVEDNIFLSDYSNPENDNKVCGICILDSNNCILKKNSFNICNILIYYLKKGDSNLEYFYHDIDTSNTVNGKPVYYYKDCKNIDVPPDAGQVIFVNVSNSRINGINNCNTSFNVQLFYSNDNTIENVKLDDCVSGFWIHYSNYNNFKNNIVENASCSMWLWHSSYNFFQNNILLLTTIEQYCDHNIFIKNCFFPGRSYKCSLQIECSNYNIFKFNNIYGTNLLPALILDDAMSVRMYKSRHTIWDRNYWDSWVGLKNKIFVKHMPKIIVGLHRSIYVPAPRFNFPSYVNFDWHPAKEPHIM